MKINSFRLCCQWAACGALLTFLAPVHADDDDPANTLKALETALLDEATAKAKTSSANNETGDDVMADEYEPSSFGGRRSAMASTWMAQLQAYLEQDQPQQVEQILTQISTYSKSEAVRAACTKLREDLRLQHEAKEQAALKRYRDAAAEAENTVKTARSPADMDAVIKKLGEISEPTNDYRASEAMRREASRVQGLRRYVINWQDYLASRQNGDNQQATNTLRNLAQEGSADVLPRSELLARIEELKTSKQQSAADREAAICAKMKTLDQLAPGLHDLRALQTQVNRDYSSGVNSTNLTNAINELQSYAEVYNAYQAGLPTSVDGIMNRSMMNQEPLPAELLDLKAQLLRLVCARQLNVEDRLKPGANESIQDYLNRVMADARERGDARLILRVRDMQRQAAARTGSYSSVPQTPDATNALQSLLAAQNQEEAGQCVPAVVSYQTALKTGSDVVPAKIIGARLDAIKAAHPAEYEKGMQIALGALAAPSPRPPVFP